MWADAALNAGAGEGFISNFLNPMNKKGYAYVDVLQPDQSNIIRYTSESRPFTQLRNPKHPARYAVTFEHDINPELRRHWVAGATIRVIDRQTDEVIAEKTTYAFEKG